MTICLSFFVYLSLCPPFMSVYVLCLCMFSFFLFSICLCLYFSLSVYKSISVIFFYLLISFLTLFQCLSPLIDMLFSLSLYAFPSFCISVTLCLFCISFCVLFMCLHVYSSWCCNMFLSRVHHSPAVCLNISGFICLPRT